MAIGIGNMFGFHSIENFNYPYIARTITEFWRRWHMSLSSWFRDYVYIPLGGNRVSHMRHLFNIIVVWLLTGFWHGADWNFIFWGLYFGLLLLFEKYVIYKFLEKLPKFFSHIYLCLCIVVGWTIFDANSIAVAFERIGYMFSFRCTGFISPLMLYQLKSYAFLLIIGAIGCTSLPSLLVKKVTKSDFGGKIMTVAEPLFVIALILTVTAYLVDGSFNPFIYFKF